LKFIAYGKHGALMTPRRTFHYTALGGGARGSA
jgi:hypothetical protein